MSTSRRATIHDVARDAGVSSATVSKILNGVKTVKKANVDRVQEAIRKLGYRADPVASELRQGQRRLIAVIVPELENSFFGALVSGIEEAAEAAGYKVIFGTSRENENREIEVIQRMDDWRVAGAIVVPVRSELGRGATRLDELGLTSVLVDRVSANTRFDTVASDNYKASSDVADHLVEQGHTRFLLHCATTTSQAIECRVEGFMARLADIAGNAQIDTILFGNSAEEHRYRLRNYLDGKSNDGRPLAIFSLSQHSTLVALSELRRRKLVIPEQVALVGFDDADWMKTTWPSITSVSQPVNSIAKRAVATLLSRLNQINETFVVQHLERCALQIRESTQTDDAKIVERHFVDQ
ncbi:MAG: LacI family DNA-binding transcriptional regulator [Hyphomicrobiales bacterium]